MAGYKTTLRDDGAISMWSFDGDYFDAGNRNLISDQMTIIDEINNTNPALLHVASLDPPHGYRLGMISLVSIEMANQYSCCFGYNGKVNGTYTKAFLEVPHSISYAFDKEFSIEFMMNKATETQYIADNPYSTFDRPIIKKSQVFNMYYNRTYPSGSYFKIWFPSGNTASLDIDSLMDRNLHVVITWKVVSTGTNQYQSTERVYIDGRTYYSVTKNYLNSYPNINVNTPFEIAGTISGTYPAERQTAALYLDQISVFNKFLTPQMVGRHYKKIYAYDDMIINQWPANYWPLNDSDSLVSWTANNLAGGYGSAEYYGNISNVNRSVAGPSTIPNAKAANFRTGGSLFAGTSNTYGSPNLIMNTSGDYSIEFWFNVSTASRGVLFSTAQDHPPYHGVTIELNMKEKVQNTGWIEFTEVNGAYINSATGGWNDGKWHHLCVRRSGTTLSLWLDGTQHSSLANIATASIGKTGWMRMMDSVPGNLQLEGSLSKVAIYSYAIEQHQIEIRYQYGIMFWIRGVTTLQGIPTSETIRVYDHETGALITEIQSNVNTGEYLYYLPNNKLVDVLVFNKNDPSVRYRAFGPIAAAECTDSPTYI